MIKGSSYINKRQLKRLIGRLFYEEKVKNMSFSFSGGGF